MIEVKFNFTNASEAASFLVSVQNIGVHHPVQQGLALESGEFIPAEKLNAKKPAPAASGQATATAGAAPVSTAEKKNTDAPSAETAQQDSTVATAAQATEGDKGNAAAEPSAPETPAVSTASSSEPVEYPVLQKAVFTLAGKSREAAAAVAASFGVKTFKELPQDKWADALAAVNAKIAEL